MYGLSSANRRFHIQESESENRFKKKFSIKATTCNYVILYPHGAHVLMAICSKSIQITNTFIYILWCNILIGTFLVYCMFAQNGVYKT